jgi:rSAM/selenodomain-associated transferase 2
VKEALDLLRNNILVLGPATDGGYYLIGISSLVQEWLYDLIFEKIPWGTDQVFNTTVNAIAETGLNMGLLDEKSDVDEPEDLVHWEGQMGTQGGQLRALKAEELSISVIVPVLNEEENIRRVIGSLKESEGEIVVADGGSTDRTVAFCEEEGIKIIHSSGSRAVQMNAGASEASGNIFLFLHADTTLPVGFTDRVKEAVLEGSAGGAFLFGTDCHNVSMSIIENAAHFRSWRLGIVFGDQAIFATREAFYRAGTYPDQPIMEDYELWKRLGKVGRRSLIPMSATTSARKWENNGLWRTTLIHQTIMWLYLLGVGPGKLASWYKKKLKG